MKIALIAGEASGDLLAADLMGALKSKQPDIEFIGMGGPLMQAQGLESWFDYKTLSVMGFIEVMKRLPALLSLRKGLMQLLIQAKPDVVIGIDAPDFNLGLEKLCKKAGLRTIHFVSPSVWAWRRDRARKIGASCDLVLCLFPMEPAIYQEFGIPARYVGHPLADSIPITPDGEAARQRLGVKGSKNLAILPGSRLSEVDKLLPDFLDAAVLLQSKIPGLQLLIPAANFACRESIEYHVNSRHLINTHILDGQSHDAMLASDAILLATGTATLEGLLCKRPMVAAYKVSPFTYRMVKRFNLIQVTSFSLPNILSGKPLISELIQNDCNPEAIAGALLPLLQGIGLAPETQDEYLRIHLLLKQNAASQAADAVLALVSDTGK